MAEDDHEDEAPPRWTRLLRPLESEAAAFRMLVWAAAVIIALIAVVLLVRAL